MRIGNIKKMLLQKEHVIWVAIHQILVRGLIAIKFLLAARLLGAEQIGLVGIATLSLAIVESLSETGLAHAVIQRSSKIDAIEAGAIWTLQIARGLTIAIVLFVFSIPIAAAFKLPSSVSLIVIASILPVIRNAFNPGVHLISRDRDFRRLAIYESSAALLDLSATLLLISAGIGAASLLVGNLVSDSFKLAITWTFFRMKIKPSLKWRVIDRLSSFGKWIWGSSVIALLLNQLDKILVARFLGATEFGLYQVSSRVAQLVITDGAVALAQYLYPTFAKHNRESPAAARKHLVFIVYRWTAICAGLALALIVFSSVILQYMLGQEWMVAAPILKAMALPMFVGALIALLVVYLRGTGHPRIVTQAAFLQLLILAACAPLFLYYFSSVGMAYAAAFAGAGAATYMARYIMLQKGKTLE